MPDYVLSAGAPIGQTLTQMVHSVQSSGSIVTTSCIMLIAIDGHRSMHPPHPVHFSWSIVIIILPLAQDLL